MKKIIPNVAIRIYCGVFILLIFLTALTVFLARFDFGGASLFVIVLIAALKSTLVLLYFMHMWQDSKFYVVILLTSIFFVSLFFLFPILDIASRDWPDENKTKKNVEIKLDLLLEKGQKCLCQ